MADLLAAAVKLLQANQAKKAEDLMKPYYPANVNNSEFLHLYGLAASHNSDYASGVERLNKAIALNPRVAEYHHNIAAIYRLLGEFELSEQCYLTALNLKPDYSEAFLTIRQPENFLLKIP